MSRPVTGEPRLRVAARARAGWRCRPVRRWAPAAASSCA